MKLANLFGETIAQLVQGVSKIGRYKFRGGAQQRQAENYLKLLLATTEDVRVILIKLADRLHNMETLSFLNLHKRRAISKETLEVYAPIAYRLGLWRIMSRLEDLAFKHLYPRRIQRHRRTALGETYRARSIRGQNGGNYQGGARATRH